MLRTVSSHSWIKFSLRLIFTIFVGVFVSCTRLSCEKNKEAEVKNVNLQSIPQKTKEQYEKELLEAQRLRVFVQALAIERAAWKVILNVPESDVVSVFYPLVRAYGKNQTRVPVPKGKNICDQFVLKPEADRTLAVMTCRGRTSPFATVKEEHEKMIIEFIPKELADIVGLGTSLTAKKATCHIHWQKNTLTRMSCFELSRDRSAQEVVILEKLNYTSEGNEVLRLEGKVLKDLIQVSSIRMSVPVAGAIDVTETWLPPPPTMEDVQAEVIPPPPKPGQVYEDEGEASDTAETTPTTRPGPALKPRKNPGEPTIEVDPASVRHQGDEGLPDPNGEDNSMEESGSENPEAIQEGRNR